jgi:tetratricopeptide (TPR) repeat protein
VRMPSKAVSSQLQQLERNQLIKKIPTSTKNHLYQINECFFNIYYLIRLGRRRNRNRVLWLVKFFEICCGDKELVERTRKHITAMREGRLYDQHAFYVSSALAKTPIPYDLQHELLEETKKYLTDQKSEYIKDIERSHFEIFKEVIEDVKKKNINGARKKMVSDGFPPAEVSNILANLLKEEGNLPEAIQLYMDAVEKGHSGAMFNLALLYFKLKKNKQEALHLQKTAYEREKNKSSFWIHDGITLE